MNFIQAKMNPMSTAERATLDDASFEALKSSDLMVITKPYAAIGFVLVLMFILVLVTKMPSNVKDDINDPSKKLGPTIKRLYGNIRYRRGVVAQFFYVGAQITCWTFIIQYGTHVLMKEGIAEQAAEITSQKLNMVAMVLFCAFRFVCTWLLKYVKPEKLLSAFAAGGTLLLLVVIFAGGRIGLYALVGVSIFMSLMFPTIYGLALGEVGDDAEIASAGQIMAILGGSLLPPVQALFIDKPTVMGMPGVYFSFIIPLICFLVVGWYGLNCGKGE